MALKASVAVEGLFAIERLLDAIGKAAAGKVIRKALREGSKSMLNTTRNLYPIDTGLAKKSLTVLALKRKPGRVGFRIGFKNVGQIIERSTFGRGIGPHKKMQNKNIKRHFYPAVIEYGDKDTPAQSPMRQAFSRNKEGSMKIINEELRLGINEAANRAAT